MNIIHIITGLNTGGAEKMLMKFLSATDRQKFNHHIVSLTDIGPVGKQIDALGFPIYALRFKKGLPSFKGVIALRLILREIDPCLIQGWMYHGNLMAFMAGQLLRKASVVWNVRHTVYDLSDEKFLTAQVIKLGAFLSKKVKAVIYNSFESEKRHQFLGYCRGKSKILPNGFDTHLFSPSRISRKKVRNELCIDDDTLLIGLIARYNPMKDHMNFIEAAKLLQEYKHDVCFLCVGRDVDRNNSILVEKINKIGLQENFFLLGERIDIPEITASLDIASSSSSFGEAFPNVIGEAMSCAVPCAVTDVGDSGYIVGDTGIVVPPKSAQLLANAWERLILLGSDGRAEIGGRARQRVIEKYSLPAVVEQYEELYRELV